VIGGSFWGATVPVQSGGDEAARDSPENRRGDGSVRSHADFFRTGTGAKSARWSSLWARAPAWRRPGIWPAGSSTPRPPAKPRKGVGVLENNACGRQRGDAGRLRQRAGQWLASLPDAFVPLWARSGYYQSGGAFGCPRSVAGRDGPGPLGTGRLLRQTLLLCASRQFPRATVQHWWHPPARPRGTPRVVQTTIWLPSATCRYVIQHGR